MQKPKTLMMAICDDVIEDKKTNKKSLIGLFNQIGVSHVPAKHQRMHVYFALTGGNGKYKTTLQYSSLNNLKALGQIHGEISFGDPNAILECDFELVDVLFPEAGVYNFQLLIDGEPIAERKFLVGENH